MSGYAASARIVRASPRVVARGSLERPVDRRPTELAVVVLEGGVALAPPPRISVAERWLRFRDRWDQLTFFVTDPDSWR